MLSELHRREFTVHAFEPRDGWSARNLAEDLGEDALMAWRAVYPTLPLTLYDPQELDLDAALGGAELVLVHEWSDAGLIGRLAARGRAGAPHLLVFHDTHHRMVSGPKKSRGSTLTGSTACSPLVKRYARPIDAAVGAGRCSDGMKPPICTYSVPARSNRTNAIWYGSATGATRSAPPSSAPF